MSIQINETKVSYSRSGARNPYLLAVCVGIFKETAIYISRVPTYPTVIIRVPVLSPPAGGLYRNPRLSQNLSGWVGSDADWVTVSKGISESQWVGGI